MSLPFVSRFDDNLLFRYYGVSIAMDEELKSFRDLMLVIFDHHERPWNYSNPTAQAIYADIAGGFPSFGDSVALEKLLPSEEAVSRAFDNRYLYLNPVTHKTVMVPLLTLESDFGRSIPEVRLQLGLFLKHHDQTRFVGFRFEAPEGKGGQSLGRHNYYHMQMIQNFRVPVSLPSNDLEWIPDAEPTIPLDADGAVKLLLTILVSLYGMEEVITLIGRASTGTELQKHLGQMHCHKIPELEWYWKVTIGKTGKSEYWKTSKESPDFKTMITKKHQGSTIIGVTSGTFAGAASHKTY
jgi:hypothetical protein